LEGENMVGVGMSTTANQARGFARLSPEERAAMSRKGGQTAHARGTAHQFTPEEARKAGRKGGLANAAEHFKKIGRIGGLANARKRTEKLKENS
jgi:general stress protein YciG